VAGGQGSPKAQQGGVLTCNARTGSNKSHNNGVYVSVVVFVVVGLFSLRVYKQRGTANTVLGILRPTGVKVCGVCGVWSTCFEPDFDLLLLLLSRGSRGKISSNNNNITFSMG
jgi:hypothetical protein